MPLSLFPTVLMLTNPRLQALTTYNTHHQPTPLEQLEGW
jgi:hypothetical protein